MRIIARIHTDFPEKFGLPRQSGLVPELTGEIRFEPEYRSADALRGLEEYDYLWLLWQFEIPEKQGWTPLVRPPRLGGNKKMGVFATRSPFRPNPIGLSCVKLEGIEETGEGPVIRVSGIDLRDGTPIYDIKPYLPYVDAHPDARGGFADRTKEYHLEVIFPGELLGILPESKRNAAIAMLREDPRPAYQEDPERIYGVIFAGFNITFSVKGEVLTVIGVETFSENQAEG